MPHTTHIVRSVAMMASPARTSHLNSFRADTPRQREPSARNLAWIFHKQMRLVCFLVLTVCESVG